MLFSVPSGCPKSNSDLPSPLYRFVDCCYKQLAHPPPLEELFRLRTKQWYQGTSFKGSSESENQLIVKMKSQGSQNTIFRANLRVSYLNDMRAVTANCIFIYASAWNFPKVFLGICGLTWIRTIELEEFCPERRTVREFIGPLTMCITILYGTDHASTPVFVIHQRVIVKLLNDPYEGWKKAYYLRVGTSPLVKGNKSNTSLHLLALPIHWKWTYDAG